MAAAWADKVGSSPWEHKDPVGVIGITAPAQWPMLGLCSLLGPAIAAGNTVVIVPSDKFPLVAADLCQVREVGGFPGGWWEEGIQGAGGWSGCGVGRTEGGAGNRH